jgi:predicted metallopeptidase
MGRHKMNRINRIIDNNDSIIVEYEDKYVIEFVTDIFDLTDCRDKIIVVNAKTRKEPENE